MHAPSAAPVLFGSPLADKNDEARYSEEGRVAEAAAQHLLHFMRGSPDYELLRGSDDASMLESRWGPVWAAVMLLKSFKDALPPERERQHMGLWRAEALERSDAGLSAATTVALRQAARVRRIFDSWKYGDGKGEISAREKSQLRALLIKFHDPEASDETRARLREQLAGFHGSSVRAAERKIQGLDPANYIFRDSPSKAKATGEARARHNASRRKGVLSDSSSMGLVALRRQSKRHRSLFDLYF